MTVYCNEYNFISYIFYLKQSHRGANFPAQFSISCAPPTDILRYHPCMQCEEWTDTHTNVTYKKGDYVLLKPEEGWVHYVNVRFHSFMRGLGHTPPHTNAHTNVHTTNNIQHGNNNGDVKNEDAAEGAGLPGIAQILRFVVKVCVVVCKVVCCWVLSVLSVQ